MPRILNGCRRGKRALLYALLALPLLAFYPHFFASNHPFAPPEHNPDTIVTNQKEWKKFYRRVERKKNQQKDSSRKSELNLVLQNLDNLKNSIQQYGIKHTHTNPGFTDYYILQDVIYFNIERNNTANFVHETTHGGQYQQGEIVYRRVLKTGKDTIGEGVGDDFNDELNAYKAQYAFDPSSISQLPDYNGRANSLRDMTVEWLLGLSDSTDTTGRRIYQPNGKEGIAMHPVNIYSNANAIRAAYPLMEGADSLSPGLMLGNDTNFLNYPTKLCKCRLTPPTTSSSTPPSQ